MMKEKIPDLPSITLVCTHMYKCCVTYSYLDDFAPPTIQRPLKSMQFNQTSSD